MKIISLISSRAFLKYVLCFLSYCQVKLPKAISHAYKNENSCRTSIHYLYFTILVFSPLSPATPCSAQPRTHPQPPQKKSLTRWTYLCDFWETGCSYHIDCLGIIPDISLIQVYHYILKKKQKHMGCGMKKTCYILKHRQQMKVHNKLCNQPGCAWPSLCCPDDKFLGKINGTYHTEQSESDLYPHWSESPQAGFLMTSWCHGIPKIIGWLLTYFLQYPLLVFSSFMRETVLLIAAQD